MLVDIVFYDKVQNPKIQVIDSWNGGLTLRTNDPITDEEVILEAARPYGETGVYWASSVLEQFLENYSDFRVISAIRTFPTIHEHFKYLEEWGPGYGVADNLEIGRAHV